MSGKVIQDQPKADTKREERVVFRMVFSFLGGQGVVSRCSPLARLTSSFHGFDGV